MFNTVENLCLPEIVMVADLLKTHSENPVVIEKVIKIFASLYGSSEKQEYNTIQFLIEKLSYFLFLENESYVTLILSDMYPGFAEHHIQLCSDIGILDRLKYLTTVENPELRHNAINACSAFASTDSDYDEQQRDSDPILLQWIIDLLSMENGELTDIILNLVDTDRIIELAITTESVLFDILLTLLPEYPDKVLETLIYPLQNNSKPDVREKAMSILLKKGYHFSLNQLFQEDYIPRHLGRILNMMIKADSSIIDDLFDSNWISTTIVDEPNYSYDCDKIVLFFMTLGSIDQSRLPLWMDRGLLDIMETIYKSEDNLNDHLLSNICVVLNKILKDVESIPKMTNFKPRLLALLNYLSHCKCTSFDIQAVSISLMSKHFGAEVTEAISNPIYGSKHDVCDSPFLPTEHHRCLMELQLLSLLSTIRNKESWWLKVQDPDIAKKWKDEALIQGCSIEIIDYAINILKASKSDICESRFGLLQKDIVKRTVSSDNSIDSKLLGTFLEQVAILENDTNENKDWHPFSNEQVRNLIHPSLYCLVYKKSKILPLNLRKGVHFLPDNESLFKNVKTALPPKFESEIDQLYASTAFQWIPSEFFIDKNGEVRITSYINNLNPVIYKEMYRTVEKIFERFIPMFEIVLGSECELYIQQPFKDYDSDDFRSEAEKEYMRAKQNDYPEQGVPDEVVHKENTCQVEESPSQIVNEQKVDDTLLKKKRNRFTSIPVLYEPVENKKVPVDLTGRSVQVIVKMANIHLTSENPQYNGGSWHIEGTPNESIVATGIYYYDQENITTSNLAFRTVCRSARYSNFDYPERDNAQEMVFGFSGSVEVDKTQCLGSIECKLGRCIVFPNKYQHQVQPFELKDKTKPGHRKILVFFLIDPNIRIVSTAHIAPQQLDWYQIDQLNQLPSEICDEIKSMVDGTFTDAEAKQYRLELMKERSLNESHFQQNIAFGSFNSRSILQHYLVMYIIPLIDSIQPMRLILNLC
ncbi:hypothetical protein BC833DRAFT_600370 [Globomyces pollinis-pini]|nr:hypothetical protein BC833DRAFT_600370 [Globomyces pollinis-pini]